VAAVTWWAWTLLWVVLVLGAGGVLYLAVRRLIRQGMALARELGAAADMLAEVTRALDEPAAAVASPDRRRPSTRRTPGRPRRRAGSQDVR
jgi:hypothetical protein